MKNIHSKSSQQSIEVNRQNHPVLNQIYKILAELKIQGKHIVQCPVHLKIQDNKTVAKEPISVWRYFNQNTMQLFEKLETLNNKKSGKQALVNYTTPNLVSKYKNALTIDNQYGVKLSRFQIGHTRLTHKHIMTRYA